MDTITDTYKRILEETNKEMYDELLVRQNITIPTSDNNRLNTPPDGWLKDKFPDYIGTAQDIYIDTGIELDVCKELRDTINKIPPAKLTFRDAYGIKIDSDWRANIIVPDLSTIRYPECGLEITVDMTKINTVDQDVLQKSLDEFKVKIENLRAGGDF